MGFFVSACRDVSFGAGALWKGPNCWRTEAVSLGSYLVIIDAALFAISIVIKHHISILSRTNHRCTEMVTKSRQALADMQSECHWTMSAVTSTKRYARQTGEEGGRIFLAWLPVAATANVTSLQTP
jgi:hypothetical protein